MTRVARHVHAGLIEYGAAWALQQRLCERRQRDEIGDVFLTCEHPHVITVGRRLRAQANILSPRYPVFEVERGGDVTYHGPGQLVGYPIIRLEDDERDLHRYLRDLETALIDVCQRCGVPAGRREGYTGVWTAEDDADRRRKLASMGIAVRRWVTFHGFALNVTTDLSAFSAINPCGFESRIMTSLAAENAMLDGDPITLAATVPLAAAALGVALRREVQPATLAELDA